jgi:peptidoglycan hydrolase CwlO-like protein
MMSEFESVVTRYKLSLLEYKVTGQSTYKQQAEAAEKWLNDYLKSLQQSIQSDSNFIDQFAKNYEKTNPELVKFQKEIAEARKQGPELNDLYEGELKSKEEVIRDDSMYYTKAAIVGGVLALGAVLSFF